MYVEQKEHQSLTKTWLSFLFLVRNRHHTALFIHNGDLRLLIRKGPIAFHDNTTYASEWAWKAPQISDDQWHTYELIVDYPNKVS